jgi:hypothetical protein
VPAHLRRPGRVLQQQGARVCSWHAGRARARVCSCDRQEPAAGVTHARHASVQTKWHPPTPTPQSAIQQRQGRVCLLQHTRAHTQSLGFAPSINRRHRLPLLLPHACAMKARCKGCIVSAVGGGTHTHSPPSQSTQQAPNQRTGGLRGRPAMQESDAWLVRCHHAHTRRHARTCCCVNTVAAPSMPRWHAALANRHTTCGQHITNRGHPPTTTCRGTHSTRTAATAGCCCCSFCSTHLARCCQEAARVVPRNAWRGTAQTVMTPHRTGRTHVCRQPRLPGVACASL